MTTLIEISREFTRPMLAVIAIVALLGPLAYTPGALAGQKKDKGKSGEKKNSAAPRVAGKPVLWEARGDTAGLNLYWGIGSEASAPRPPFTFDKEDTSGTNPKVKVTDAKGDQWNVKFDEEVNAEVAASRFAWACGYMVEENYFVASGQINGVTKLGRAKKFIAANGSFKDAMFEKRPDDVARRDMRWSWENNPFVGTRELSGLVILIALVNNWDAKVDNNNVLGMHAADGSVKDYYILSDWGASFGDGRGQFHQSKWQVEKFVKLPFIKEVAGGKIRFAYRGRLADSVREVSVEHARWFAGILGQLTDAQISDAFRAAGATDEEQKGFAARMRQKISELQAAVK